MIGYLGNRQRLNIVFTSREFQVGGAVFDSSYRFVGPSLAGRAERDGFPHGPNRRASADPDFDGHDVQRGRCTSIARASRRSPAAGHQVVLAAGHRVDRRALPDPPANFIVRRYVPQVALLERAAVFITHGGINSAHEAMLRACR